MIVAKNSAPPRGLQRLRMNCGGVSLVMFLAEIAPLALALRMAQSRRARGSRTIPTAAIHVEC